MRGYGESHVLLEALVRGRNEMPVRYRTRRAFSWLLFKVIRGARKTSLAFALGEVVYHLTARAAYLRAESESSRAGRG
jgi:hypothetical protein